MAIGTFKVTAKTKGHRRNSSRSSSPTMLFTLSKWAGLAVMLVAVAAFFIKTSGDGRGAKGVQASANGLTRVETPAVGCATAKVRETYGQLALSFEANHGQAEGGVDFVARGAGYTLALSPTQAAFRLQTADGGLRNVETAGHKNPQSELRIPKSARQQSEISNPQSAELQMNLVDANREATVTGQNELDGRVNYFIGNDPSKWQTDVKTFGRVRYTEVYPGIDVVYYGNQRQLEYDFVLDPGRDPSAIALEFAGADGVEIERATGDLLVRVKEQTLRQHAPITYQESANGGRREIKSRYTLREGGQVGFEVGAYDLRSPLVIDPVLQYSTYLGGSGSESGVSIAVDSAGNAYVTGSTSSTNFPTVNPIDGTENGSFDVFVTKINAAGTAVVYSTYLGGSSGDGGSGIVLDSAGNAYVVVFTTSTNFPTINAIDSTHNGGGEIVVTKINAAGTALVYSTYLGGSGYDEGNGIALDSAGNAYVAGWTQSTNFPTVNPIDSTRGGFDDAFVTKINAAGTALVYSTYLGGNNDSQTSDSFEEKAESIAVDSAGNVYVAGYTETTDFPRVSPIQATHGGGTNDAFVAKINAAGTALVYSTYLGGNMNDAGRAIAVDSAGNAYVAGETNSANFPTLNAIDSTLNGSDAIVSKINPAGSLVYSTYLGGESGETAAGIAVDSAGNAYVAGSTSSDFPAINPIAGMHDDGDEFTDDGFVTKINAAGSVLVYSTYLGGNSEDEPNAIAVDSAGNAYVTGFTRSACFPTTVGAFDTTYNGSTTSTGGDGFISKISETASPTTLTAGTAYQFSQTHFVVSESAGFVTVNVMRLSDTSAAGTVDYATTDNSAVIPDESQAVALCGTVNGVALSKCDFNTAVGTLRFAPGETTKSFTVLLTQDSYVEGTEETLLTLSNPSNGALLCNVTATLEITDDSTEPSTNAIDDPRNFVRQHYHDFLNREPDQAGWDFWTDNIAKCNDPARRPAGQTVEQCIDKQRETTSGAFFLSPEFQYTGSYIYGVYRGSLNRRPTFLEFMRDLPQLVNGIIVNGQISGPAIEANRAQYVAQFVQRTEFASIYGALSNQGYVDKLFQTTGTPVSNADKQALVNGLNGATETRSSVLHKVVNGTRVISEGQIEIIAVYGKAFYDSQFNPAFVQMEYFGYMRRNEDQAGFDFWLGKLNFYGDFISAEMVRSFLLSPEYRRRFGSQ